MAAVEEDQYQLSDYERQRLERIKKNEAYLAQLGLTKTKEQVMREMTRARPAAAKRRTTKVVTPGEERRSKRLKKLQGADTASGNDALAMLSYAEDDDRQLRAVKQSDTDIHQVVDTADDSKHAGQVIAPYRRTLTAPIVGAVPLTDAEKQVLAKNDMDQNYLDKFREFLVYHDKISPQNERNVMRQVTKLATGEGVRYESAQYGWPEGCYFLNGTKVTPLSDLVELMHQAVEAENRWGRDRGNGWLLRHPIKKLLLFQQFCLNNPDFLTAKCKLKDYYNAGK